MRYLVSTHSFLIALTLDEDWQVQAHHVLARGHHYGVALLDKDKFLAKHDNKELWLYSSEESFDVVDKMPLYKETGQVHQIACQHGGLYIANTEYNNILFQPLENSAVQQYHFEDVSYDLNHFNSIFPCGDRVLALLHNHGKKESEIAILKHNLTSGFVLEKKLSLWHQGCHNIFVDDHYLVYNASAAGKFVVVDLHKEKISHQLTFPGHVKGLSVMPGYYVIGYSDHVSRDQRYTSKGHLAVIDRKTFTVVATIDLNFSSLPHPVGNVNEIRCISGEELGHARTTWVEIDWSSMKLSDGDLVYQISSRYISPVFRKGSFLMSQLQKRLLGNRTTEIKT
jgi:hypothetical protein